MTSPSRIWTEPADLRVSADRAAVESTMEPWTPEQEQRARLRVAASATDAADCRELLEMLGLVDAAD